AFGTAALLQLGYLNPFAPNGDSVASHPDAAVLGGAAGPGPSAASTPGPRAPGAVIARIDFDELRIGPLAGASDDVGPVAGGPEVVAFPSPFDRSIRVVGDGSHRFCIPVANFVGGRVSFDIDVYATTPTASGRLKLSMAPSDAGPTVASVPLDLLGGLRLEAWHHLSAVWTPGQPVAITIDPAAEQMQTVNLPPAGDAQVAAGAACVAVSGMAKESVLHLDNLWVEQ
ncbi:MAG TPA: hypothetical protein VES36_07085, partial [Candidatus Limnocylindrales bacterium]|nr:hypothetical protein [Candidatus Limnocylindrales bacterium]